MNCSLLRSREELGPLLALWDLHATKVLIEVEDELQSVATSQVRKRGLGNLQADAGFDTTGGRNRGHRSLRSGHRQHILEDFIRCKGETELRRGTENTSWSSLEESPEALFLPDGRRAVTQRRVSGLSLAGLDLQTSLDNIARGCQVSCRHTRNGTGGQELHNAKLLRLRLSEKVGLEVGIGGEIDGGERN